MASVAWIAEQWADALHQWLGITDDCVHIVTKGKDCQLEGKDFQFLITSYNFVTKLKEQLQILAPKVMVLDEAHSIKASKVPIHKFGVLSLSFAKTREQHMHNIVCMLPRLEAPLHASHKRPM